MLKKYKYMFFNIFFFVLLFLCTTADAASSTSDSSKVVGFYENIYNAIQYSGVRERLEQAADSLFMALAGIYFIWSMYQMWLEGKAGDIFSWCINIARTIVYISFFKVVVSNAWNFNKEIGEFFSQISGAETDFSTLCSLVFSMAAKPSEITEAHFIMLVKKNFLQALNPVTWFNLIATGAIAFVAEIIILVAGSFAMITAITAQFELYLIEVFALLAIGFFGSVYTKDIAIGGIRAIVSSGVKVTVVYLLMGLNNIIFSHFVALSADPASTWFDVYDLCGQLMITAIIFGSLYKTLPDKVAALFGGGGGGYQLPVGARTAKSAATTAAKAVISG